MGESKNSDRADADLAVPSAARKRAMPSRHLPVAFSIQMWCLAPLRPAVNEESRLISGTRKSTHAKKKPPEGGFFRCGTRNPWLTEGVATGDLKVTAKRTVV
jgi:hypothetical protein